MEKEGILTGAIANANLQMPLYEQVVKTIEGQIVAGVYRKGDLLPSEKELTETMGVSRITVRKALSILAEMGFIATSKGRGSEVLFSIDDREDHKKFSENVINYKRIFKESSQIRLMLEPEIARAVAKSATKEQVALLKECLKESESEKKDFHLVLVSLLNNENLKEIINNIITTEEGMAPSGVFLPERQEEVANLLEEQHWKIFRAIEHGEDEFAYFYMKEHTKYITEMYEKYFEHLYF